MSFRFRYSEWDGSQEIGPLDPDDILAGLTDDLMNFGDLQHALRNLLQRGMRNPFGQRMQGLRDILQQLRQQRRQTLDRYNLDSVFEDIKKRLDEVIELEKGTLDSRLQKAERQLQGGDSPLQAFEEAVKPSQQEPTAEEQERLSQMLKDIVEKKKNTIDNLPEDVGGQVKELQNYEFMDPEAGTKFKELMEMLKKAMMDTFFKDIYNQIANMSPEEMARMKEMIRELNEMLSEKMAGGQPDFQGFMDKYGDLFGDNPPQSLEQLIEEMQQQASVMQALLDSLPPELRQQLQDLLMDKVGDLDLQRQLQELSINLDILYPSRELQNQYPFRGDEELDLLQAMSLMDNLQDLDDMEKELERTQYGGDLEDIDEEKLRELLGEEAAETLKQLKEFLEILEEAGYIRRKGKAWELTPKGVRKIGEKALGEIYTQLKKSGFGKHALPERGIGGERADETKRYEFGDPFHLNLGETIMNAVLREGPQVPVRLDKDDFEVFRSETLTSTTTVMMLDLSWSMALRGSFQAAKRVALALQNLIRTQFPKDSLYILGFSAYARELRPDELPYVRWDESVLGTNMHHAFMIAQKLLARHKVGTRQIIMISDGEPTAHLEHGRSYFAYPPSPITIRETLKEVRRCTRKGIVINTFMLDRNYYLKEFVNQIAKMNKGRVFYTTPENLGQYLLVDYVSQKRKRLGGQAA
ncbi:MAG: VWA domain-containing protein [Chloroflexi bacterium]|nr:VWA domain-containing protein [Chloroflexota bacterium]